MGLKKMQDNYRETRERMRDAHGDHWRVDANHKIGLDGAMLTRRLNEAWNEGYRFHSMFVADTKIGPKPILIFERDDAPADDVPAGTPVDLPPPTGR